MTEVYDIIIRGGTVVDGTGAPGFQADVALKDGLVAEVGRIEARGREEIDARGKIVTPGFVDVHTHYDGQATWEQRMSPSSNHGVTTVITGNCGVGFAPCRPEDRDRVMRLMEGVEDVPEVVMAEGLPWNWETFPDYLDSLSSRRFDIDIGTQIPHAPLRVYVMGERGANREVARPEELAEMSRLVADAVAAGAFGVSTSRLLHHRSADGTPTPTLDSAREELAALATGLRDAGGGVFQIVPNSEAEPETEVGIMREIVATSGRPLSFSLVQAPLRPTFWRRYTQAIRQANDDGQSIKGQIYPRPVGMMFGLDLSFNPLCRRPSWDRLADRPLAERVAALRDAAFRKAILAEEDCRHAMPLVNVFLDNVSDMFVLGDPPNYMPGPDAKLGMRAAAEGRDLMELALDEMLRDEGHSVLYLASANYAGGDLSAARAMMDDPNTVVGLGDGGAHYGLVCDASYPTTMLTYWGRDAPEKDRIPIEEVVAALSRRPALLVGLEDRGVIAPGKLGDLNVIDQDALTLRMPRVRYDLPAGGRRLSQAADGYVATIKRGVVTYRDGAPTDALPGLLIRRPGSNGVESAA